MRKVPLVFAVLVLLSFSVSAQGLQAVSEGIKSHGMVRYSVSSSTLMVNGNKIVDKYGREVKLRGFSLWDNDYQYGFGDREPYAPKWVYDKYMPLTQEHLNQIKRWGFNVVLMPSWWTGPRLEPNEDQPQVYNEEWVDDYYLEVIRMANEAGLYVIAGVRVCYDPGYTSSGNYPWYGWATHDYVVFNQLDSSGQRGLERFCKFLEWFTQKVQGEPNVIGIDPWHFPYHRQSVNDERVTRYNTIVAPAIINAVRKHTDKIIFLSPVHLGHYDYTNHQPYNDHNIVYNTGGYGYHDILVKGTDRTWDYDVSKINHPHRSIWTFRDKHNVPVMSLEGPGIGQHPASKFGRPLRQDRVDLFDALLTLMDDLNGWIVWQYSGPGLTIGVLENEDPHDPASEGQVVEILKMHTPP